MTDPADHDPVPTQDSPFTLRVAKRITAQEYLRSLDERATARREADERHRREKKAA